MGRPEEHLRHWQDAGLIDAAVADRILAAETSPQRPSGVAISPLEPMLYLGVALVTVGVIAFVGPRWEDLEYWGRVAVLAVPGVLALAAGFALRSSQDPRLRRALGLTWAASLALLSGAVAAGADAAGVGDNWLTMSAAAFAVPGALLLWSLEPRDLQVAAVAASFVLLAAATAEVTAGEGRAAGSVMLAAGAGGIILAELALMAPRLTARLLFGVEMLAGSAFAGTGGHVPLAEAGTVALGLAVVVLGLARSSFTLLSVGVGGVFLGLVIFIFEYFEDELGAPMALIISGALLVAAGLLLGRLRFEVAQRPAGGGS